MGDAFKSTLTDRKLRLVFAGLALMALAVAVISWQAARMISGRLAISQAEQQAVVWRHSGLNVLSQGASNFVEKQISPEDQRKLLNILQTTDTFRMVMLDADGKAFWSSNPGFIGLPDNSAQFNTVASTKGLLVRRSRMPASDVDRLLLDRKYENIQPNDIRETTIVYVPVIKLGKFVGILVLYSDTTELVATYRAWSDKAAILMAAVLTGFIVLLGWLISSYARQRRADEQALTLARDDALAAHAEVDEINQDVVLLNQNLQKNMKQLHHAQAEIIRKGKMAQMGQLTATLAHDIRNPLGTVNTAAFLIERKFLKSTPDLEKPLARIRKGIERCDGIIGELLDFARNSDPQYATLKVDAWVQQVVEKQAEGLPEVVQVECHLGLGDKDAEFDSDGIQQVLVNFLFNASEAMVGKGDDPENFYTRSPKIVIATLASDRGVELHVTDCGPGMSKDLQQKVLEPLFTTKNFGVGLGLPSVEKVLQSHGGGLEIRSVEGEGTTMIGWYPFQRPGDSEALSAKEDNARHLDGSFLAA